MNPFIELMQAAALIMLLFAAVLITVAIRHTSGSKSRARLGPIVIGTALILFAIPIYASVIGSDDVNRFISASRIAAAVLLPVGLFLLGKTGHDELAENDTTDDV